MGREFYQADWYFWAYVTDEDVDWFRFFGEECDEVMTIIESRVAYEEGL